MRRLSLSVILLMVVVPGLRAAPPMPATPAGVDQVVYTRPFTLNNGFRYDWCSAPFQVTQGTILVLKVNPQLVIPRQVQEPILYVGNHAAMRLNHGNESGYVVALVPGDVDLTKDLVWFGTPQVPDRINAARVQAERQHAEKAGIRPLTPEKAQAAAAAGGARINTQDMSALLRDTISGLVEKYSPQESYIADAWRLPVITVDGTP